MVLLSVQWTKLVRLEHFAEKHRVKLSHFLTKFLSLLFSKTGAINFFAAVKS